MNTVSHVNTYSCPKKEFVIVSCLLIISFVLKFIRSISKFIIFDLNSFEYSEFLINFQGGFVRRGIIGETLFQLYCLHSYPLKASIFIFCYSVFIGLLIFFFLKFKQKNYCWWLLLSPLFFNFTTYIVRKDYLLYALLIVIIYLLRSLSPSLIKKLLSCLLVCSGLLIHESFIFWGFAIYALILISDRQNKIFNYVLIVIPIIIVGILAIFKGFTDTPQFIINSWNSVLPDSPIVYQKNNSIGAIGWDTIQTFKMHLKYNLSEGGSGLLLIPLFAIAAYYMNSNFLYVFDSNKNNHSSGKLAISLLFSFMTICLIPMLSILSCDTGRIFQYATITTFSAFLILPENKILMAFPRWYKTSVINFNNWLNKFIPPSRGLMIILLIFLSISPYYFSLYSSWRESVVGSIFNISLEICRRIYTLFFV